MMSWIRTVPAKSAWPKAPVRCVYPGCEENAMMATDFIDGPWWCIAHRAERVALRVDQQRWERG